MRIALVVPGGVDRSAEFRIIPALVALIERLSADHDVVVFALHQEAAPAQWRLAGAQVLNIGLRNTRLRAVRTIVAQHRRAPFAVVHAIWSGSCGLIAVLAAKFLGLPSLVHIAGGELACLPQIQFGGRQSWRGRLREAYVLRTAALITAASSPTLETLHSMGFAPQRVPLGVDLGRWPPRAAVRRVLNRPAQLIHVASLNAVKDQSTLLAALSTLERAGVSFQMTIVGEDTLQGAIQCAAHELGVAHRVRFHGFLTQRQLRPLVEAADLMILASRHETGPVVLLEAAIAGVPTIGTAVGHLVEWAPEAALAVPVGDAIALAAAITSLLNDDERRLRIARAAQTRAIAEDADYTARRFTALYEQVA